MELPPGYLRLSLIADMLNWIFFVGCDKDDADDDADDAADDYIDVDA